MRLTCSYYPCGTVFDTGAGPLRDYCSPGCADAAAASLRRHRAAPAAPAAVCDYEPCGAAFVPSRETQRFCSHRCGSRHHAEKSAAKKAARPFGDPDRAFAAAIAATGGRFEDVTRAEARRVRVPE